MVVNSNDDIFFVIDRDYLSKSRTLHLLKYNQAGAQVWSKQLGANGVHLWVHGLAADDRESFYLFGHAASSPGRKNMGKTDAFFAKPNKGGEDMFIAAYNQTGALLWKDQLGTGASERAEGICLDDTKNVYLCANTLGSTARQNNGTGNVYIVRFDDKELETPAKELGSIEDPST